MKSQHTVDLAETRSHSFLERVGCRKTPTSAYNQRDYPNLVVSLLLSIHILTKVGRAHQADTGVFPPPFDELRFPVLSLESCPAGACTFDGSTHQKVSLILCSNLSIINLTHPFMLRHSWINQVLSDLQIPQSIGNCSSSIARSVYPLQISKRKSYLPMSIR